MEQICAPDPTHLPCCLMKYLCGQLWVNGAEVHLTHHMAAQSHSTEGDELAECCSEESQKRGYSPPYHPAKSVPVLKHKQTCKESHILYQCSRPHFNIHTSVFLTAYRNEC